MPKVIPFLMVVVVISIVGGSYYYTHNRVCPLTFSELMERKPFERESWEFTTVTDELDASQLQVTGIGYMISAGQNDQDDITLWCREEKSTEYPVRELAPGRYKVVARISTVYDGELWSYEGDWTLSRVEDYGKLEQRLTDLEDLVDLERNHWCSKEEVEYLVKGVEFRQRMEIAAQLEDSKAFESLRWKADLTQKRLEDVFKRVGEIDDRTRSIPTPMPESADTSPVDPEPAEGPIAIGYTDLSTGEFHRAPGYSGEAPADLPLPVLDVPHVAEPTLAE